MWLTTPIALRYTRHCNWILILPFVFTDLETFVYTPRLSNTWGICLHNNRSFCQNNNFFLSKSSPCPVPRGVQSESQRESQDPSGHFQPVQAVQRVLLHGICLNIFCLQLFACHPLRLIRPMLPIWAADVGLSDDCFSASVRLSGSNRADFVLKSGDFANWRQWLRKTAQWWRWSRRPQKW